MLKFTELLKAVKEKEELKVLTEGKSYFTVENEEGYRAYCQADFYGGDPENTNYYRGYTFSTVHKPNRKTGTGWQEASEMNLKSLDDAFKMLDRTLERSKSRIQSGKERMDDRQPKNGYLF